MQDFANTAWAFVTAGQPASAFLQPTSVLNAIESHGTKPQVMYYEMVMEGLAATCRIVAGFVLLARVEATGLLSCCDEKGHPVFTCCSKLAPCSAIPTVHLECKR